MTPAVTTSNLLVYSLQVAAIVVIGGGAVMALRLTSPRARLLLFRALVVSCLALPFVQPVAKALVQDAPVPTASAQSLKPLGLHRNDKAIANDQAFVLAGETVTVTPTPGSRLARALPPEMLAKVLWAVIVAGIVARLAWLLVGFLALKRLRDRAKRLDLDAWPILNAQALVGEPAEFLSSDAVQRPVTFGAFRRVVILPASYAALDEAEQTAIACHELLHVRRRDWLFTVGEELVRAVLWFHPAIWWVIAQIDLSREQVVDQQVVALTQHRKSYVNALVRLAVLPAGPALRPASLFLGRAHLLERVALLSREVRMSRLRFAASLVLIVAAVILGGRLIVEAFPLARAPQAAPAVAMVPASVPTPLRVAQLPPPPPPPPGTVVATQTTVDVAPAQSGAKLYTGKPISLEFRNADVRAVLRMFAETVPLSLTIDPTVSGNVDISLRDVPWDQALETVLKASGLRYTIDGNVVHVSPGAQQQPAQSPTAIMRYVDTAWVQPTPENGGRDSIVVMRVTVGTSGTVTDVTVLSGDQYPADFAVAAVRAWAWTPPIAAPFTTVVGMNLARNGAYQGIEPVRVGGNVKAPVKIKDVRPIYPQDAQEKGIQGMVIAELLIDGDGTAVAANVVRSIPALDAAALGAMLQWKFLPDPQIGRKLMTVTCNFTLGGVTGGIVEGVAGVPPPPPPPPGVTGGVYGGVSGGIGGVVDTSGSFGLPPSQWPTNAVRVGGNIKAPLKTQDVPPVYPPIATAARVQGMVIAEILVGEDGSVEAARILRSIPLLDQAGLDAVRQWRFTPTLLNGVPVSVIMTVTVNFSLQ